MSNQKLPKALNKPVINKFEKCKVYLLFKDSIWGDYLVDVELKSNNKGIRLFLCVIDIFSKNAWVIALKEKIGITINNTFQKV